MTYVMKKIPTDKNRFVEIQGTGEEATFSSDELMQLISLATKGCHDLYELQRNILGEEISGEITNE